MKTFKQTDYWISTGLIIICTVINILSWSILTLIHSYFIIGGWQVISMLVHMLNHWFMKKGGNRSHFHWVSFTLLAVTMLGFALPPLLMFILCILLVISPFLAVIYTLICYEELKELKLRHSLNLK
ncbi:MAG TPA: hypothetical protein VGO58_17070 [Chitinophagaceae bacterium]|jgi:hypothetical protein|nr:hypothetical protein [Chitinophagaceae bacterium]